jgi:Ala-tRNA(Pro) deacylase
MSIATNVERFLRDRDVTFELMPHKTTGSTHESAEAAHVPEDHFAKAVMVCDDEGDAMAVIPGNAWLELDKLNREVRRAFRLEAEPELKHLFEDCAPGAVPPVGMAYGLESYLDEALTTLADVYFEAGDHHTLVHVRGDDFLKLMQGVRRGHFGRQP